MKTTTTTKASLLLLPIEWMDFKMVSFCNNKITFLGVALVHTHTTGSENHVSEPVERASDRPTGSGHMPNDDLYSWDTPEINA